MHLSVQIVVTLLVAIIFATIAFGRDCPPQDGKCGKKICKTGEICQFIQTSCEYGSCPLKGECVKPACVNQAACNLLCIVGYTCELKHVEGCGNVTRATCVPKKPFNCGNQQ